MSQKAQHMEEYVMVFPTALLMEVGYFQGLSVETTKYIEAILERKNYKFIRRKDAETDYQYKQVIPYVILECENNIFTYRRGKLLTEARLLGNYSVGVGGHISVNDPDLFGMAYQEGLQREINEEVNISCRYNESTVALINSDTSEVSKVHFGIIHVFSLDEPLVKAREKSINEAKFLSISELKENISKYEDWSQICINELEKLLLLATGSG